MGDFDIFTASEVVIQQVRFIAAPDSIVPTGLAGLNSNVCVTIRWVAQCGGHCADDGGAIPIGAGQFLEFDFGPPIAAAKTAWAEYKRIRAEKGEPRVALTREFRETVYARAQCDSAFRRAFLTGAVDAYLAGDEATGKAVLRDLVNCTIGFERLAAALEKPSKSLHRMLGPRGNPNASNFFNILRVLQKTLGVRLSVRAA